MPFKIKEARKEKGFTQGELAKRANVSRATIIGLENGSITVTTTETLTKIAGTASSGLIGGSLFASSLPSKLQYW